jgi:AcrR family transcriptional regulator
MPISASDETSARVLVAAQECFSRYGFRRTSMSDIAGTAGFSRARVYQLYPSKEAIFRTLASNLHASALERAEAALRLDVPFRARLVRAFQGKLLGLLGAVEASPHAAEILQTQARVAGDLATSSLKRFTDLIAEALAEAASRGDIDLARVGLGPNECAELMWLAAEGLKGGTGDVQKAAARLEKLIDIFLAAMEPKLPANGRAGPRDSRGGST